MEFVLAVMGLLLAINNLSMDNKLIRLTHTVEHMERQLNDLMREKRNIK